MVKRRMTSRGAIGRASKRYRKRGMSATGRKAVAASAYIPRPLVVPNGMIVDLPYVDTFSLVTSGGSAGQIFRGASIFDPDFTGFGHQPLGHDQWANLYGRYRVLSCRIEAHFANNSLVDPINIGVTAAERSNLTVAQDIFEQPYSKIAILAKNGADQKCITMNINTATFEGDTGARFDKDYTADFGANPVRDWFYYCTVKNANNNVEVDATLFVRLIYKVRLYDRVDLAGS